MKKLIVSLAISLFSGIFVPGVSHASQYSSNSQEVQTCTTVTQYGGSVSYICGVHTPVETGIGDYLPLIGSLSLGASGVFAYFSKKLRKLA